MNTNFKLWLTIGLTFVLISTSLQAKSKVEILGDIIQIALPLYTLGRLGYEKDTQSQMEFLKSIGATVAITQVLKRATHIRRPDGSDFHSFPSGHTSAAFAGASFLHTKYNNPYQNIIAYSLASYVGYSRVYAQKHHIVDVLAGGVLAYGINAYFVNPKYTTAQIQISDKKKFISVSFWK